MKTKKKLVMKKMSNILAVSFALLIILLGCNSEGDKMDYGKEVIIVTGTENDPLSSFVVDNTPATYVITASSTGKVKTDVVVDFDINPDLVEEYNKKYNTGYYPIPESAVELDTYSSTIKTGRTSSTPVNLTVVSMDDFVDGRSYLVPVTIKNTSGGDYDVLDASRTIFLKLAVTLEFSSLDLSSYSMYSRYICPEGKGVTLDAYTFQVNLYTHGWSRLQRVCNFGPKDESIINLLRFGEYGMDLNQLQWISPAGSLASNTRFEANKWYNLSFTFDGSVYTMYVNGEKDTELSGSQGTVFESLELGMSWTGYRGSQRYNGRMSEFRIWDRALTSSEIQTGMCAVDPSSPGLITYWKFDEGTGHIFHDATGKGYDMDWTDTWREEIAGQGLVHRDYSSFVRWIFDQNNKCVQ